MRRVLPLLLSIPLVLAHEGEDNIPWYIPHAANIEFWLLGAVVAIIVGLLLWWSFKR
jgi:hypothetical protein